MMTMVLLSQVAKINMQMNKMTKDPTHFQFSLLVILVIMSFADATLIRIQTFELYFQNHGT